LLNEEENEQAKQQVESEEVLRFEYHYNDVIPAGMISRFICKQHNNISKDKDGNYLYWRYGALMKREETVALVEQPIGDKSIKITVKGTEKRELLAIVRNAFEELHAPLNKLQPNEVLPCNCSKCRNSAKPFPFKYEIIKRRLHEEDVFERCDISDEKIDRRKLFNDAIDESFRDSEKIRQLITEGKLEKALSYLNDKDEKAILGGHLSRIDREEIMGLLDADTSLLYKNKLAKSILKLSQP
jgi:internalin A